MSGDKTHMQTESIDELLLVKYLLGKLTEEEQVQVEDRAFADRHYMAALDAAEADLIDGFVSGDLAGGDRRAFEQRFLTSPQRRSKVEFAQALATVAGEMANEAPVVPKRAWWKPPQVWFPVLQFAGAA